jgi:hypothetical protein
MNSQKVYVNDIGTEIILDTGVDISGAIVLKVEFRRPDGSVGSWVAAEDSVNTRLKYVTLAGDLKQAGVWKLQGYVELDNFKGRTATVDMEVFARFA